MSSARWTWPARLLLIGVALASSAATAGAQDMGRSLGGFGAATIGSYYRDRQGPLIPYSGGFGGFVPYRSLEAPPTAADLAPRPIRQTPIGGASRMGIPIGGASLRMRRGQLYTPLNIGGGMGWSPGMGGQADRTRTPGFGYPFRRPPSLNGGGMGSM